MSELKSWKYTRTKLITNEKKKKVESLENLEENGTKYSVIY